MKGTSQQRFKKYCIYFNSFIKLPDAESISWACLSSTQDATTIIDPLRHNPIT